MESHPVYLFNPKTEGDHPIKEGTTTQITIQTETSTEPLTSSSSEEETTQTNDTTEAESMSKESVSPTGHWFWVYMLEVSGLLLALALMTTLAFLNYRKERDVEKLLDEDGSLRKELTPSQIIDTF